MMPRQHFDLIYAPQVKQHLRTIERKYHALIRREIETLLQGLRGTDPAPRVESEVRTAVPSSETAPDDPFVIAIRSSGRRALGRELKVGGFRACCDMWPFRERGTPAAIFGPGELAQAHTVGEWIELAQVEAAARFYALAALAWLGVDQ